MAWSRGTSNTAYQVTGPANTDRVSGNADLGLTYHITKSWSVSDKFRWLDWRDPGVFNQLTINCYSNLAAWRALSTPTGAPCGVAGITDGRGRNQRASLSASAVDYNTLEAERTYFNTATLNWAPSRRISAYAGYRYGRRELTDCLPGNHHQFPDPGGRPRRATRRTYDRRPSAGHRQDQPEHGAPRCRASSHRPMAGQCRCGAAECRQRIHPDCSASRAAGASQHGLQGEPLGQRQRWRAFHRIAQ